VPRSWFGAYLEQTLNASIISKDQNAASNSASFRHFKEKLVHLSYKLKRSSWQVTTSHRTESFDRVILATGFHSHMQTPAELNALQPTERWIAQPFQIVDFKDVAKESQILIVGSGLTAIDCWRSLRGNGHTGHITMLSRHGRLPLPQFTNSPLLSTDQKLAERATPRELFSLARKLNAEGVSWQDFANLLRPSVQRHWQDWSTSERGQFTRHIKHWWDLIRHRVPPSVFAELQSDIKQGRLVVSQGRIVSSVVANDRAVVSSHVSNQHTTKLNQLECDLVIIATGANVDRSNLLATPQLSNGAYAIGPAAKDQLWEITAIPEIREQVEAIVKQLEIQSQ
jgi:uncharacterized NAD(P)/FAD-binding protein YdhS